ncbi:hypothetical protein F7725_003140 [Dissostichus mawsoni]|uniref:mitogen-activated protein kinase n=1 Tax=Dissostichus mawsoni TaxID=36200 RepID=A0A7J5Y9D6_DISMA|nr:hypothetical protein F7725_003140 [Dissostichus mawsoni]
MCIDISLLAATWRGSAMDIRTKPLCYELLAEVGEGSYGKVYKARELGEKQRFLAVKKFNIRGDTFDIGIPAFMIREVALLMGRSLDLTLVLEYIDQDLSTYLSKVPASGLSHDCIKDLMWQLLQGLDFLHTHMVLHRDLKPENILISSREEVKIADFGLARIYTYNIALTPGVVTLWYRAPEVLLNSVYMSSVDMWSAGCIFAELFLLRVIGLPSEDDWPKDSPIRYSVSWGPKGSSSRLLHNLSPYANDLLSQCLAFRPSRRISAAKALTHPFFMKH